MARAAFGGSGGRREVSGMILKIIGAICGGLAIIMDIALFIYNKQN